MNIFLTLLAFTLAFFGADPALFPFVFLGINTKVSRLIFDGDDRKYQATLRDMDKKTQSTFARMKKFGKQHALAIAAALTGLVYAATKLVGIYAIQEASENRLRAALRATGQEVTQNTAKIKKWAAELQKTTTVGDEQAISLAAMGVNMAKLSTEQLPLAMKTIANYRAGLAKADGKMKDINKTGQRVFQWLNDLSTAVTELDAYIAGWTETDSRHVKQLLESGRKMEAQNFVLEKLNANYKGMAAAQREGTGILKSLNNAFGDAKEKIGQIIWKGIQPLINKITESMEGFELSEETIDKWAGRISNAAAAVEVLVKVVWAVLAPLRFLMKISDQLYTSLDRFHKSNTATPEEIRRRLGLGGDGLTPETATVLPATVVTPDKEKDPIVADKLLKLPRSEEEIEHEIALLRMRNAGISEEVSKWYDKLYQLAQKRKKAEAVLNQTADNEEAKRQKAAAQKELDLIKMKEEEATKQVEKEMEKRNAFSFNEAKTAIGNLGLIVGGREKAAKLVAIMDTAQAVRGLYKSLFTEPPKIFAKIVGQTGLWGIAKAVAVSAAAAVAIKQGISRVKGYNTGGYVPGRASLGDVVPAMLTGGEFVVNSDAAATNRNILEAINSGRGTSPGGSGAFDVMIGFKDDADKWLEASITRREESGY